MNFNYFIIHKVYTHAIFCYECTNIRYLFNKIFNINFNIKKLYRAFYADKVS